MIDVHTFFVVKRNVAFGPSGGGICPAGVSIGRISCVAITLVAGWTVELQVEAHTHNRD
jgi:hypothetical protein